ncbi:exodeoxyribonuclease V, beta subunit [gamma proteobacterium HTCC5015]|nr:exodeoxyribonuclease V, beta subunit [gamma proteobacterium HTCC5015]
MTFPLHGRRLIEASAGTGKTFTLAGLYLRLVLGHGDSLQSADGHAQALRPQDILVMTFTEAATQELRERIRERLAEAAEAFSGRLKDKLDPLLTTLLNDYPDEQHSRCAHLLNAAAQDMDEAAITTIHGFCQRMLREHAFDSRSLFNLSLQEDEKTLTDDSFLDYWRSFALPLEGDAFKEFELNYSTPSALQAAAKNPLKWVELLPPPIDSDDYTAHLAKSYKKRHQALMKWHQRWHKNHWMEALREHFPEWKTSLNGQKYQEKTVNQWFAELERWLADPEHPLKLEKGWTNLSPEGLAENTKKNGTPPEHELFESIPALEALFATLDENADTIALHAAHWVAERIATHKQRRSLIGFDDMISQLAEALDTPDASDTALAQRIRQQYPIALVDEFQDTDPKQWRIFQRLYPEIETRQNALVMIGDPKQAIYQFRGADIYTYLDARRSIDDTRRYTLPCNYRSSEPMVAAVNHVFNQGNQHKSGAFMEADIPFEAVQANGRKERFVVMEKEHCALTLWYRDSDVAVGKNQYLQQSAADTASEIVRLLNLARDRRAGFINEAGQFTALAPSDIAILVRSGSEAQVMRDALAERQLRSAYLSNKESVFDSPEARDVLHWLRACHEPRNDRHMRAALGTITLDLPWADLDALNHDEASWNRRYEQFAEYHQLWQRSGVLAVIYHLVWDFHLAARQNAERSLSNILQLAELLQSASGQVDGEAGLLRWLEEHITEERDASSDEQVLRLESDDELIKIVTLHKSKGLEYPLVFMPFCATFRPANAKDFPQAYHNGEGQLQLALSAEEIVSDSTTALEQCDRERLAEDLRLLYVGMTRPRHALWLGLAPTTLGRAHKSKIGQSVWGHLLNLPADDIDKKTFQEVIKAPFQALAEGAPSVQFSTPELNSEPYLGHLDATPLGQPRECQRAQPPRWWMASYSALLRGADPIAETASGFDERLADEGERRKASTELPSPEGLHPFPRGAMPGDFLHRQLELMGEAHFERAEQRLAEFKSELLPKLQLRQWEHWQDRLPQALLGIVQQALPLPDNQRVALADLKPAQYHTEMEFHFAAHGCRSTDIDRLIGHDPSGLKPQSLNGLLKGFIDLVFEHEGRYYVLDYKSNYLGPDDSAYTQDAMAESVREHRYDLQYALYSLALHRLLKQRLPNYDYDKHFGGAIYYFLRGYQSESRGVFSVRLELNTLDALDALFSERHDEDNHHAA